MRRLTCSSATTVARPRLPVHAADLERDAEAWVSPRDSGLIDLGLNILGCGVRIDAAPPGAGDGSLRKVRDDIITHGLAMGGLGRRARSAAQCFGKGTWV